MPYVKRKRRAGRKFSKRKRRFGRRRRRGGKGKRKVKGLVRDVIKTGSATTLVYKTAIRVASKTGTCNYVVLAPDPDKYVFDNGTKAAFGGDMSFYGPGDMAMALNGMQNYITQQMNTRENDGIPSSYVLTGPYTDPAQTGNYFPISTDYKSCWKMKMDLFVKSAITGSNVNITLYQCKARYDIPKFAFSENTRTASSVQMSNSTWAYQSISTDDPTGLKKFMVPQNMHSIGWAYALGLVDTVANAAVIPSAKPFQHQEGTTLYDNKVWCSFFKITKQYKAELVPGQVAKVSLKKKLSMLNIVKQSLSNHFLCTKGQVFFVLKIEGSMGHSTYTDLDPLNQTARFYPGAGSRPDIGIMPAAVDVICFKKMFQWTKYKPVQKIKNFWKTDDYKDDNDTEGLSTQLFIDSAPSDYTASAAVIN